MLGWWKQSDFTLYGKVRLMKTYDLSKLNFVSSLKAVPDWVLAEAEKLHSIFFGMGRTELKET